MTPVCAWPLAHGYRLSPVRRWGVDSDQVRNDEGGYHRKSHEVMTLRQRRVAVVGDASPRWKGCDRGICVAPLPWVPDRVRNDGGVVGDGRMIA